jgi:hypothetical protein
LPVFAKGRHPEMMPASEKEEAEIFMRKLMSRIGKAGRTAERNADQARWDLALQVRTAKSDKIEARAAVLRKAEKSHMSNTKARHGQGEK